MNGREEQFDFPSGFERNAEARRRQDRAIREELEADEHRTDPRADFDANELHPGPGLVCARCGRPIGAAQPVRRTVDGHYQHDSC